MQYYGWYEQNFKKWESWAVIYSWFMMGYIWNVIVNWCTRQSTALLNKYPWYVSGLWYPPPPGLLGLSDSKQQQKVNNFRHSHAENNQIEYGRHHSEGTKSGPIDLQTESFTNKPFGAMYCVVSSE